MQKTMSSLARHIGQSLMACVICIACAACSPSGNETVIDLYGDALCADWTCGEPQGSDALDQTKLSIEGSMWMYGTPHLMEKGKDYASMVLLSFEAGGRLRGVSVDQTRDSDTKKIVFRMDRLDANYRIEQGHINFQGLDQWFKYVTKAKVVLGGIIYANDAELARAPTRLSLQLTGGTKSVELPSYTKGYNREVDKQLEILLATAQAADGQ